MVRIAQRLFDKMNEQDISYVHFKSNEHLEEGLSGLTDLDLLISGDSAMRFQSIVCELKFRRAISHPYLTYPSVEEWIGFDDETGKLLHLHVHYRLITGRRFVKEWELPWQSLLLSSAQKTEKGVKIPAPELELILLITRVILKMGIMKRRWAIITGDKLKGNDGVEYHYLLELVEIEKLQQYMRLCFPSSGDSQILAMINCATDFSMRNSKDFAMGVRRELTFANKEAHGIVNKLSSVYRMMKFLFWRIEKKFLGKWNIIFRKTFINGKIIAFIGCDGSGKSTVSKDIEKWLRWKLEVSSIYLGSGKGYKSIYKFFRSKVVSIIKKGKPANVQKIKEKVSGEKANPIIQYFENIHKIRFVKQIKRKLVMVNRYRMKGGICVLDRFPQLEYRNINDGPKVLGGSKKQIEKELKNLGIVKCIHPDIVIKLTVPLETALERRADSSIDILKKKIEIVDALEFKDSKVFKVDATQPYEAEMREIKNIIWDNL